MKFPWFIPLGTIAGLTVTWAFFGYVVGDWNPQNWHWFARMMQAAIGIVGGTFAGIVFEVAR